MSSSHVRAASEYSDPQSAVVQASTLKYKPGHFFGVPVEIRKEFYRYLAILDDQGTRDLSQRKASGFLHLLLTGRQAYHEVNHLQRRSIVAWHRMQNFMTDRTNLNKVNIQQYRSLSLEISLNAHPGYFRGLANVIHMAQPHLRELHLYFIGSDGYDRQTSLHGCGNLDCEKIEPKLPIDGQQFEKLLPLWQRILSLRRLEVLVIANANMQVYQAMILSNKPCLEYVHLSADPRSTIHMTHNINRLGHLLSVPEPDKYPPIKAIHIAANATLSSVQMAIKVAGTLEHLTWTVPDPSLSSGAMALPWYEHTSHLIDALRLRGPKLRTLRICIGGDGLYEDDHEHGAMMGSMKMHLPHLESLRHFELHLKNQSCFFGKELVLAMPKKLEYLYLSDRVVDPDNLLSVVDARFMKASTVDAAFDWEHVITGEHLRRQDFIPLNTGRLRFIHYEFDAERAFLPPSEFDAELTTGRMRLVHYESGIETSSSPLTEPNVETSSSPPSEKSSTDDILFDYEYEPLSPPSDQASMRHILFRINGRLIDRARNSHLARLADGSHIRPKQSTDRTARNESQGESATESNNIYYAVMLYNLYDLGCYHRRDPKEAMAELSISEFHSNADYFGEEDGAQVVFDREPCVKPGNLRVRTYPMEQEVFVDGKCHWACPDAEVPSMDEREETWKMRDLAWEKQRALMQSGN